MTRNDSTGMRAALCNIVNDHLLEREVQILHMVAERLLCGQRNFGGLFLNKKSWTQDIIEENVDSTLYSLFKLLDLKDAECQKTSPTAAGT